MTTQIVSTELSVTIWSEIQRALPRIAEELGCSIDELHIMDHHAFPGKYMDTQFRDIPYKLDGFLDGLPFVQNRGTHVRGKPGYGIAYYKSRLEPNLRYAAYIQRGEWQDVIFLVIPKKQVFPLVRMGYKLTKAADVVKDAPILAEGVLENILNNTIGFLKHAKKIEKYGVKIKKGILLDGPPGNGKTMLCRYIQKLCTKRGYRWGVVTAADIDKAYADKELTPLFQQWTVTFFDDIDVSYLNRKEGAGKMACSLLTAMDGMFEGGHLVRIFTTNETLDKLDEAFVRPGRIDTITTLEKPDAVLRRRLVTTVWPKEIVDNIDVDDLINATEGFSFAEVEAIRTYLVTWKVVCNGDWDLERALDEFDARKKENRKTVGFGNEKGKRKKKASPSAQQGRSFLDELTDEPAEDRPASTWR
jgi:hypothetical protein